MLPPVKSVPNGFHTITPHLCVKDAAAAIEFYRRAFGADVLERLDGSTDRVVHATLAIGDSVILVNDESPTMLALAPATVGGTPVTIHLYVEDVDAWVRRAIDAGAEELMPVSDMYWGDRYAMVADPFGHRWSIATHTLDLTFDEIAQRQAALHPSAAT